MPCKRCRGRKHVLAEGGIWKACDCVNRAKTTDTRMRAGISGEARPVSDFGDGFGKFVRAALGAASPSLLIGDLPWLMEAAQSALEVAVLTERKAKLVRLATVIDAAFDREKKAKLSTILRALDVLVLACGDEPDHKWAGPCLYEVVGPRRLAGKPTLIASTGDLSMYGEKGTAVFRGLAKFPSFKLSSTSD